jgi:ABC-type glycerol-3-phosphate transport system permease component
VQFLYRALFVVPMVIPGLIVVMIWRSFFFEATAGYLNKFLFATGFFDVLARMDQLMGWGIFVAGKMPAWLGDPKLIIPACIIWGFPWVGSFAVLTYLAKLQGISKDVYEAAEIDGVSWWSKFTRIELPLITGSIYLLLVFVIIESIKDAGMIMVLVGVEGGPGGIATVPALFMLRKAFVEQQMGYACAVGIVLTTVVMSMQKISSILLNWGEYRPDQRRGIRTRFVAGGFACLAYGLILPQVLAKPDPAWPNLLEHLALFAGGLAQPLRAAGAAMLVAALPYGWVWDRITDPFRRLLDLSSDPGRGDRRAQRWVQRQENPLYRAWQRASDLFLRGMKHATILGVLGFAFLPLYLMMIVSVKSNQQFYEAPAVLTQPVFWENWATAWKLVTPPIANSMFLSITSTCGTLFLGLCGSYFFARLKMPLSSFFWNAILILMMMPAIANLVPLFTLLRDLNLLNTLSALIIVGASGGQIFAIFMLRGFVQDIPQDLFEAAEIDGASHFQQLMNVVLPLSGPILGTVGVMHFIGAWNDFVLPLIVMRDHARLPIMVQLARMAGEYIKLWGPLMAGYAIASIPIIVLFIFSMKLFIKGLTEGAVKG